ncbi:hypothetical protein [Streptomyces sp. TRM64462]|uniref:hypothetical protein n=1 Tax=Streptomyces sp. TRM64462 TaxID=2741726 RepID=UPI0015860445|nr:hypothetical protein [Streptomyces sp. TRM64462]
MRGPHPSVQAELLDPAASFTNRSVRTGAGAMTAIRTVTVTETLTGSALVDLVQRQTGTAHRAGLFTSAPRFGPAKAAAPVPAAPKCRVTAVCVHRTTTVGFTIGADTRAPR